jgi:hypothetical protein
MPECKGRKHTPIVSKKQQKLFGMWASKPSMRPKSITSKEVKSHLTESKGKKLPNRSFNRGVGG